MSIEPEELAGIRALLVGGTSGIGLECARLLAERGAAAIRIAGRNSERGEGAANELRSAGFAAEIEFLRTDCSKPEDADSMASVAERDMGGIDFLVASAGGNHLPELLFRMSTSEVRSVVAQDLLPNLLACRAVLPGMMKLQGGSIVTVASDAAKIATPGESVIGASMAALVQFTRGLAIEGKRNGIRANCVTPSLVEGTPLTQRLMKEGTFSNRLFEKARTLAELGPTTARDVAEVVGFLASPRAARVTGQAISVNGGISAA